MEQKPFLEKILWPSYCVSGKYLKIDHVFTRMSNAHD